MDAPMDGRMDTQTARALAAPLCPLAQRLRLHLPVDLWAGGGDWAGPGLGPVSLRSRLCAPAGAGGAEPRSPWPRDSDVAPFPTFTERPGRTDLAWSGARRRGRGCQERAGLGPAPPPLAPGPPLLGDEFSGGDGVKSTTCLTRPYPTPGVFRAVCVGKGALPAAWDSRGMEGPSVGVAVAVFRSGRLSRELHTCSAVPPASEAALPAHDPGLIRAHEVAIPGLTGSEARDQPQKLPGDTPELVLNSDLGSV